MKKILRYFTGLYKKIDVSPIEGDTLFKVIIFIIWGANAILYISGDFVFSTEHNYYKQGIEYKICTYTQSFSPTILNNHDEIIFHSSAIGTISSYDVKLIYARINKLHHDRSPPFGLS